MKSILTSLLLYTPAALAAQGSVMPAVNIRNIVWNVVILLVVGMVLGLLHYAVGQAPFLQPPWKSGLQWGILIIGILIIIYILLGMVGL